VVIGIVVWVAIQLSILLVRTASIRRMPITDAG